MRFQEDYYWQQLATYNAERARGIMHTQEWQDRMAEEQRRYDAWIADGRPWLGWERTVVVP